MLLLTRPPSAVLLVLVCRCTQRNVTDCFAFYRGAVVKAAVHIRSVRQLYSHIGARGQTRPRAGFEVCVLAFVHMIRSLDLLFVCLKK